MKIFEDIEIIDSYPAIYIKELDMIVIADLHLGYEGILAEQGIFIPKIQFKKIVSDMKKIVEICDARNILINGDIKHEFSETSYHEFKEVKNFLELLKNNFKRIILIKGNHDNYISNITNKYGIELYDEINIKGYFFTHGHKAKKEKLSSMNIFAHEHPSIALFTEVGVKEKMKAFIYGEIGNKKILVMPSFSYFAEGNDVNLIPKNELLSPLLREIDIDRLMAICLLEKEKPLKFPEIGRIRQ
ncbi:MAG: metallophosphoesterase [Candidatus Thermoplasmatota archaeon]